MFNAPFMFDAGPKPRGTGGPNSKSVNALNARRRMEEKAKKREREAAALLEAQIAAGLSAEEIAAGVDPRPPPPAPEPKPKPKPKPAEKVVVGKGKVWDQSHYWRDQRSSTAGRSKHADSMTNWQAGKASLGKGRFVRPKDAGADPRAADRLLGRRSLRGPDPGKPAAAPAPAPAAVRDLSRDVQPRDGQPKPKKKPAKPRKAAAGRVADPALIQRLMRLKERAVRDLQSLPPDPVDGADAAEHARRRALALQELDWALQELDREDAELAAELADERRAELEAELGALPAAGPSPLPQAGHPVTPEPLGLAQRDSPAGAATPSAPGGTSPAAFGFGQAFDGPAGWGGGPLLVAETPAPRGAGTGAPLPARLAEIWRVPSEVRPTPPPPQEDPFGVEEEVKCLRGAAELLRRANGLRAGRAAALAALAGDADRLLQELAGGELGELRAELAALTGARPAGAAGPGPGPPPEPFGLPPEADLFALRPEAGAGLRPMSPLPESVKMTVETVLEHTEMTVETTVVEHAEAAAEMRTVTKRLDFREAAAAEAAAGPPPPSPPGYALFPESPALFAAPAAPAAPEADLSMFANAWGAGPGAAGGGGDLRPQAEAFLPGGKAAPNKRQFTSMMMTTDPPEPEQVLQERGGGAFFWGGGGSA